MIGTASASTPTSSSITNNPTAASYNGKKSIWGRLKAALAKGGNTAMRFLGGEDETTFTPIRLVTVFSKIRKWEVKEVFSFLKANPIFFLPGIIFPIIYAIVFRKKEERDHDMTCFYKLLKRVKAAAEELNKNVNLEGLNNTLVNDLITAASELNSNITPDKIQITEDGQIRIIPPQVQEQNKQENLGKPTGFWQWWQQAENFYFKDHLFLKSIWNFLTNYSLYYWIAWFIGCIYAGTLLTLTSWWILGGALIAYIAFPCVFSVVIASWHQIKKNLPGNIKPSITNSYIVPDDAKEQENKNFTEKVIYRYFLKKRFSFFPEANAESTSTNSTLDPTLRDDLRNSIRKSKEFLEDQHSIFKYITASLYALAGWVTVCFTLWPVSDLIMLIGSSFGINLTLGLLISTTVIAVLALFAGFFYCKSYLNDFGNKLAKNRKLANEADKKITELESNQDQNLNTSIEEASKYSDPKISQLANSTKLLATDDDYTDETICKFRFSFKAIFTRLAICASRAAEYLQVFLGRFGTGVALIRLLLLDSTIGAIICYGFVAGSDGIYKAATLVVCGGLFGLSPLATIAIIAGIVGILWALVKCLEYAFDKDSERAERLINHIDNRVYAVEKGLEIIKGHVQSPVSVLAPINSDNSTNQQSAGLLTSIFAFFGCGSSDVSNNTLQLIPTSSLQEVNRIHSPVSTTT